MLDLITKLSAQFKIHLCGFVFVILQLSTSAYNIDTYSAKIFSDPSGSHGRRGSYFGFSVALYADSRNSVLLVGAPRANASYVSVEEPGTVYTCSINDINNINSCKEWAIDRSKNGRHPWHSSVNQIKDNAWIGATIAVENRADPRVVICGPRWKNNLVNDNGPNWFMNGICYWTLATSSQAFEQEIRNIVIPLLSVYDQITSPNGRGIYKFGMGQAGFSLHMNSNDSYWNLAIGNPGIHNWKGAPLLITQKARDESRIIIPSIAQEIQVPSGSYFGYAITGGCYFTKGKFLYAAGAPRGENMKGSVLIFNFPDRNNRRPLIRKVLNGQQHGEYFGAALASCDLNNDGKEDLIVGAPFWTKDMDEGRVHVFIGRYSSIFETQLLEGEATGGRFGTAVSCLGDIDYDSYGDIAIGAPYEENGVIYIFNGNRNGISKTYSQRIHGSQFSQNIRGFGISISEPRDINNDRYSDIAVGAYLSEHAVLLKSKAVITTTIKLSYLGKGKLLSNSTAFAVTMCVFYDGVYAPDDLRFIETLKIDQTHRRAVYQSARNNDNTYKLLHILEKGIVSCKELNMNLKENLQNVIDPIEIYASIEVNEYWKNGKTKDGEVCPSCAVINKAFSITEDTIKLPFAVDCGEDNVCTSDLEITVLTNLRSDNRYVIGSTSTLKLIINTYNRGEPAYQSKAHLYIPNILSLASIPTECADGTDANNDVLKITCDIGNPLKTNKTLIVELDMEKINFDIDRVEFWTAVTTQSDEGNLADNTFNLTIYFDVDVDIAIAGKTQEDLYSYIYKDEEKQLSDIRFQHFYEVQKFGASPIEEAVLTVKIPTHWRHGDESIEIITVNSTIGYMDGRQLYCTTSNDTNVVDDFLINTAEFEIINEAHEEEKTHEKFSIEENPVINVPPSNRTLYINCTDNAVECKRIQCNLGSFTSSLSVAKLLFMLDLRLSKFQPNMLEEKDIIFFVSEGSVVITQPYNITQTGHKTDNVTVATTFIGSPIVQRVAIWVIALSVLLGIILLVLLILGLLKIGFFKRKTKEELQALKAETDMDYDPAQQTNSTEVLNQE